MLFRAEKETRFVSMRKTGIAHRIKTKISILEFVHSNLLTQIVLLPTI